MLIRDIMDFLLPPTCVVCGRRLTTKENSVCTICLGNVEQTNYHLSFPNALERIFWGNISIDKAVAFMYYNKEVSRRIMMSNKYLSHPEVGYHIASMYAETLKKTDFFQGIDFIVPVPISWRRAWKRRYNQSEYIARGVSDVTGLPLRTDIVKKVVHTKSQTSLRHSERMANISDAYKLVRPEAAHGKHILLIDDVVTTGSTLVSCAKEIQKAGDVTFSILALAHASSHIIPPSPDGFIDSSLYGLPIPPDL